MLSTKRALPTYPDGMLEVRRPKRAMTDFGAVMNIERRSDTELVGKMNFKAAAIREQDYEFARRESFKLALKVRCPLVDFATGGDMALIGDVLYDISRVDRARREMYLYLEEVGRIDPD